MINWHPLRFHDSVVRSCSQDHTESLFMSQIRQFQHSYRPFQPLLHVHIPGLTSFARALEFQGEYVRKHRDFQTLDIVEFRKNHPQNPTPTLLTFQTFPTYVCHRSQISRLSQDQIAYLRNKGKSSFHEDRRLGQITFHGPGQLVAFLVTTVKPRVEASLDHSNFVESAVILTCSAYGIKGFISLSPGVWTSPNNRIATFGKQAGRYVTSHHIALNVTTDLSWIRRISDCGLGEHSATSFKREGVRGISVDEVANVFAQKTLALMASFHIWIGPFGWNGILNYAIIIFTTDLSLIAVMDLSMR